MPTPIPTPTPTPMPKAPGSMLGSICSILSFKLSFSIIPSNFMLKSGFFYFHSPTNLRLEAKSSVHLTFVQNSELVAFSTTNPRSFGHTQPECQSERIVLRRKRYDAIRVGYGHRRRRLPPAVVVPWFNCRRNRIHISFLLL